MTTYTWLDVETFILCATNESSIYQSALAAARYSATVVSNSSRQEFWLAHIRNVVLPCLTRPGGGYRGEKLRLNNPHACALQLANYYARAIAEGA